MTAHNLTPLQKRFAEEYLVDLNGAAAYRRAGYQFKNLEVAKTSASRLLSNANVAAYVQELQTRRSLSTGIEAERVLTELGRLAFSDIRSVMEFSSAGVKVKASTELDDDAAAAISEVSENRSEFGGSIKLKMHNKVQALKLLAQHTGLLGDLNLARSILRTYGLEVDVNEFGQPTKLIQMDVEIAPTSEEFEQENILSDVESWQDGEEGWELTP